MGARARRLQPGVVRLRLCEIHALRHSHRVSRGLRQRTNGSRNNFLNQASPVMKGDHRRWGSQGTLIGYAAGRMPLNRAAPGQVNGPRGLKKRRSTEQKKKIEFEVDIIQTALIPTESMGFSPVILTGAESEDIRGYPAALMAQAGLFHITSSSRPPAAAIQHEHRPTNS